MIIKGLIDLVFGLINSLISVIPNINTQIPDWINDVINVLKIGLSFFPQDVWVTIMGTVIVWIGIDIVWYVINWIYDKLPLT